MIFSTTGVTSATIASSLKASTEKSSVMIFSTTGVTSATIASSLKASIEKSSVIISLTLFTDSAAVFNSGIRVDSISSALKYSLTAIISLGFKAVKASTPGSEGVNDFSCDLSITNKRSISSTLSILVYKYFFISSNSSLDIVPSDKIVLLRLETTVK